MGYEYTWELKPTKEYFKHLDEVARIFPQSRMSSLKEQFEGVKWVDPSHTLHSPSAIGNTNIWCLKRVRKGYNNIWFYQGESYKVASHIELQDKYRKGWEETKKKVLEEIREGKSVH